MDNNLDEIKKRLAYAKNNDLFDAHYINDMKYLLRLHELSIKYVRDLKKQIAQEDEACEARTIVESPYLKPDSKKWSFKNMEGMIKMEKHMKEHLIGKVVCDVEHIETDSMYGLTQSGMKISFVDGTSLTVNIEIDEELSDHPNLDWKIDMPEEQKK